MLSSSLSGRSAELTIIRCHGPTVRTSTGLVTPPDEAVIFVVPAFTPVATPELLIVATLVSLETHLATDVMSNDPLHVAAVA